MCCGKSESLHSLPKYKICSDNLRPEVIGKKKLKHNEEIHDHCNTDDQENNNRFLDPEAASSNVIRYSWKYSVPSCEITSIDKITLYSFSFKPNKEGINATEIYQKKHRTNMRARNILKQPLLVNSGILKMMQFLNFI